jgi:hypothetical protein
MNGIYLGSLSGMKNSCNLDPGFNIPDLQHGTFEKRTGTVHSFVCSGSLSIVHAVLRIKNILEF